MAEDFETYTRGKIADLRAGAEARLREADQLERLLAEFMKVRHQANAILSAAVDNVMLAPPSLATKAPMKEARRRSGSSFGAVMHALVSAGPGGMTLDEMLAAVDNSIQRPTLRSQLHHEKLKGRVIALAPGRFAAAPKATDLL